MSGKTKKFFALKNLKSLLIRQPVSEAEKNSIPPSDIVTEAEQIIENYLRRMGYEKEKKKKRVTEYIVTAALILAFFVAAYFVLQYPI